MLKNYILTTLRNIRKHPGHFAINVTGLSLGMAVFIFIVQFVGFESRYDNFHEGPIYRIATKRYAHNELINENAAAMPPLAPLISENIAGIDEITRIYNDGNCVVSSDETGELRVFDEDKAYYADGNFFKVFNFKLINGTPESALNGTRKMAISESTAKKYFGSAGSAFGKTLKVTGQVEVEYEVSGVFEDAPLNSHMKPDIIFSFITYLDVVHPDWPVRVNWVWNDFPTYMKTDGNPVELEEKINSLAQKTWEKQYKAADVNYEFFLQPIEDIHTRSNLFNEFEQNTDKAILNLLIWISIITLVVAWINYVNLATARALERAREVGVRKAIGAHRHNLLRQFFTEATITNAISITLSIALLFALKDGLQRWIGISFPLVADRVFIAAILILVAGGILAALYPAYMMSGFSITEVLKGKIQSRPGRISIRKALVLVQFIVAPVMIGGTYLIFKQTEHLVDRDLGVNKDQVLVVKAPRVDAGNMVDKFDRFKFNVEESSNVNALSKLMMLPGEPIGWYSWFTLIGDTTTRQYMNVNLAEYDFEKVLDVDLVAGRSFDRSFADSTNLIINEAAAKMWGYEPEQILGRTFRWTYSPTIPYFDKTVIGVVKNYKQHAFSNDEVPIIFSLSRATPAAFATQFLTIKLNAESNGLSLLSDEIGRIEALWNSTFPDDPFTYWFLDDSFQKNFQAETQLLKVVNLFALISVLIAGLGLFGLTSYTMLQRTKEVGIRKTMGATVPGIVQLLSKEYFILIVIAYLIALPLMWFGSDYWLQNYEIKIGRDLTLFLIPLIGSLAIGILSVMFKSISAASKNPVETLRSE